MVSISLAVAVLCIDDSILRMTDIGNLLLATQGFTAHDRMNEFKTLFIRDLIQSAASTWCDPDSKYMEDAVKMRSGQVRGFD